MIFLNNFFIHSLSLSSFSIWISISLSQQFLGVLWMVTCSRSIFFSLGGMFTGTQGYTFFLEIWLHSTILVFLILSYFVVLFSSCLLETFLSIMMGCCSESSFFCWPLHPFTIWICGCWGYCSLQRCSFNSWALDLNDDIRYSIML